jgi:hypothetical protein
MVSTRVLSAINGWFMSKTAQGATPSPKVLPLISLLFGTLDALCLETRKLPFNTVISGVSALSEIGSKNVVGVEGDCHY